MYYYIVEPPRRRVSAWQDKVKAILGDLGIAGEMVFPSTARSIEELASLGIAKGYSTIVAVGAESIANGIATAIIKQDNRDAVLGFIPDNYETPLARKMGVKDLMEACLTLKYRKLELSDAVFFEPDKYFLTEAEIETEKGADAYITLDEVKIGLPFNRISVRPGLEIQVQDDNYNSLQVKNFFNWLIGKDGDDISSSLFHTQTVKIECPKKELPIIAGGSEISKTPVVCQNKPKALKIIVKRDTIIAKE